MVRATQTLMAMMALVGAGALAESRQYSVTVRVLDPQGEPLEGVGVIVERSPLRASLPSAPADTDANGIATVMVVADDDEKVVRVAVLDVQTSPLREATQDDNMLSLGFVGAMMDIKERREVRSFDTRGYPISLDAAGDGLAWSIHARPMKTRSGVALDMAHMFVRVRGDDGSIGGVVESDGRFELRLPEDSAAVWLSAPELMSPVERYISCPPDDAPIVVSRADFETSDATRALCVARERLLEMFSVQFVRLDGQFGALATFGSKPEWGTLESVRLPVGIYYILHYGEMFASDGLDIALQAIAQGEAHEMLATLPTIEIRAGESVDLSISHEEIECTTRNFVHAALYQPNSVEALWPEIGKVD